MGVYDRDWWRERYNQRTGHKDKSDTSWRRPDEDGKRAAKAAVYNPRQFRAESSNTPVRSIPNESPPDMPGSHWHWTVKLIAIGWIALIAYVLAKLAMGLRL
jgi:hypothetical protein